MIKEYIEPELDVLEIKSQNMKTELISNVSHDLKTPIATIKSYAESIKDGVYPYDTLEKSVDVIIDNADRLEKKVYSLLLLNRLDYVKSIGKDSDEQCDMKDVVEDVLTSLKTSIHSPAPVKFTTL